MDEFLIHVSSDFFFAVFSKTVSPILFKSFFNAILADLTRQ